MKRKIAMLMSMSMVLLLSTIQMNFAFADGGTDTKIEDTENINIEEAMVEESKVMDLSIEDAVKLAKESSREMWKIDDSIKKTQEDRINASKTKKEDEYSASIPLDNPYSPGATRITTLLSKNGYNIALEETKTKGFEKQKDLLNVSIEIETKSLYYQVLVAEKTIEVNQVSLSKAEEQLRVINLKFDNGSATKAEVLSGQKAVQSAKTDLDSSKDDLEVAKLDLLNKLDLPFDTEIVLKDKELKYVPTVDINLEDALEKAKIDRPEILTALNNLDLQKIETHVYTAYYTSNLRENKAAVERLKDAELNVPQAYKDVELDVRKSYLALVKAERALVNMDKTVEIAKEASRINKLLYENGMAASTDVIVANTDLAEAEIGRYKFLVAYNISKMMFDNSNLIGSK